MNQKNRDLFSGRSAVVALMAAAPVLSFAQAVADPFDTALSTITTKVNSYGAALVGLAAVGVLFVVAMKYVKKLPRAA